MKKSVLTAALALSAIFATAQTTFISDIENLGLTAGQVYDGSSGGTGFQSGHAFFPTVWDTAWGGFWSSGWAASAKHDSATAGSANQYGCAAYYGYNNSMAFAMGTTFGSLTVRLTDSLLGKNVSGFYVCNATYTYKSIKNGDAFAKKFGDTTGTGCGCAQGSYPDWFKLTVKRYYNGALQNGAKDSVEFYLADYRYSNSVQDYALKTWTWVNLDSIGKVDSLAFFLSSSDNGTFGMNTPAYFCLDDLTLKMTTGIENYALENNIEVFPNPANEQVEIAYQILTPTFVNMKMSDVTGRELASQNVHSFAGKNKFRIDVSAFPAGIYYVTLMANDMLLTKKIIKQ